MQTKLRIFGGIVLLFNLWLVGRYQIENIPTILMTFGFAVAYELVVVRSIGAAATGDILGPQLTQASMDESHLPTKGGTSSAKPLKTLQEEMQELGVVHDGDKYRYQDYSYEKLQDAISYARLDRSRAGASDA